MICFERQRFDFSPSLSYISLHFVSIIDFVIDFRSMITKYDSFVFFLFQKKDRDIVLIPPLSFFLFLSLHNLIPDKWLSDRISNSWRILWESHIKEVKIKGTDVRKWKVVNYLKERKKKCIQYSIKEQPPLLFLVFCN